MEIDCTHNDHENKKRNSSAGWHNNPGFVYYVRLLELSKDYGHMLVISGKMKAEISSSEEFIVEHQGEIRLRGKTERVAIYTVSHGKL